MISENETNVKSESKRLECDIRNHFSRGEYDEVIALGKKYLLTKGPYKATEENIILALLFKVEELSDKNK
jgi:hypothetical protein